MVLAVNFITFGTINDSGGSPISGCSVDARSNTNYQGIQQTTTNASGQYQMNLKQYANDGDTIMVHAHDSAEVGSHIFTLTLGNMAEQADLNLAGLSLTDVSEVMDVTTTLGTFTRTVTDITEIMDNITTAAHLQNNN